LSTRHGCQQRGCRPGGVPQLRVGNPVPLASRIATAYAPLPPRTRRLLAARTESTRPAVGDRFRCPNRDTWTDPSTRAVMGQPELSLGAGAVTPYGRGESTGFRCGDGQRPGCGRTRATTTFVGTLRATTH